MLYRNYHIEYSFDLGHRYEIIGPDKHEAIKFVDTTCNVFSVY